MVDASASLSRDEIDLFNNELCAFWFLDKLPDLQRLQQL